MIIDRGEDPGPFSQPRDYVTHLRGRFRRRCAYCLTPDDRLGGEEGMKVDHFLPESRHADLRLAWSNLYYCCDVCNNRKSNFPTPDESISGKRFVDPCSDDPDDHFRLVKDPTTDDFCRVAWLSVPAEYEVKRLQFNRRRFLRDYWRELSANERSWSARRQHVLDLRLVLHENDEAASLLLTECDSGLDPVRTRWPFPREQS
jgi:uncharacterized protein (TIGR02646 family)